MKTSFHDQWLHGDNQKYKPGKNKTKPPPRQAKYIPKIHLEVDGRPLCKRKGFYTLMDKDKSKTDCTTCKRIFERWDGV